MGIFDGMSQTFRLALIAALIAGSLGASQARPLTADEEATLRGAPPYGEQNKTPEHLKRFNAAAALARRLGAEGNLAALPLLIELRQLNVLNSFVGTFKGDATPQLEAIALKHIGDPDVGVRVIAMLRRIRSPALFDALIDALPAGSIDCDYLLRAAATAEVPGVEPRLAGLLPRIHPAVARHIAARLTERQYLAAEAPLIDLLRRTPLDARSTISTLATSITALPSDTALNAAARKLIDVARLPEDKSPRQFGLVSSTRLEDIPDDGLLCSTIDLRAPHPLGDARRREVKELVRVISNAPADATLDPAILGPGALAAFVPEERRWVEAMLRERTRVQALYRDVTPDNFLHWIAGTETRHVQSFIARGADVNASSRLGIRPLVHAAALLRAEAVALLLEAGADPRLSDEAPQRDARTALHAVSQHQAQQPAGIEAGVRVMKLLLAAGAIPQARNTWGATALQYAAAQRPELVALLLEAGADVQAADVNGTTALHIAVHAGQRATVRILLDRGADVNAEEHGGVTPLLIARDNKDAELERLLASRGGRVNHLFVLKRDAIMQNLIDPRR